MTNKIIQKIDKILIKNTKKGLFDLFGIDYWKYNSEKQQFIDDDYQWDGENETYVIYNLISLNDVIFSHKFAKAFWGNGWKAHLQQMVLEDNPFKYLEKFI